MRRPLRFLAHKLALDDRQTRELAEILADLKTERAAAEVELQRAQKRYADSVKGDSFDAEGAKRAGEQVVHAHTARQNAVHETLGKLHALLDGEQRGILSMLVRTGPLVL